jgi:hypothetical protein
MNTTRSYHTFGKSNLTKLLLFVSLAASSIACQTSSKEGTEQKAETLSLAPAVSDEELNSNQTQLLESVIGNTSGGIIRGIAFGDDIAKIKATETFEIFEDAADHIGFTSETEKLESIDVQYFLGSDKKVNKIQVDVYLNSTDATQQLWNVAKRYFSDQYGEHQDDNKKMTWTNKTTQVQMEDASSGKDFGLIFHFTPVDKKALAAK